jgi:hypothetical protein
MEAKEIEKLAQISDISRAIERHLELFEGDTEQLEGALSMALKIALERKMGELSGLKKYAIVRVNFF